MGTTCFILPRKFGAIPFGDVFPSATLFIAYNETLGYTRNKTLAFAAHSSRYIAHMRNRNTVIGHAATWFFEEKKRLGRILN